MAWLVSSRLPASGKTASGKGGKICPLLKSVAAGSTESPPERHNDSKQEAPLVEKPAAALQEDCKQTMTDNDSKKGFVFSSATANVRAYQAKLLEMAQANMQLAFEFAQRLATIRSPVEILSVIAEFTS